VASSSPRWRWLQQRLPLCSRECVTPRLMRPARGHVVHQAAAVGRFLMVGHAGGWGLGGWWQREAAN
jgi:hypothetical protein